MSLFQGRGQRVARALDAAAAKIRQLQTEHAQQLAALINADNSATAMNRRLLADARTVDLDALIIDEAHRNARRLVALHFAGKAISRRGEHGLTHDQWYWAHAVLRNAGIRTAGGGWRIDEMTECLDRINQSRRECQAHGLIAIRRYNKRNRYDRKRRANRSRSPF